MEKLNIRPNMLVCRHPNGSTRKVWVKPFDCLNHEPLTAKLNAYGFSLPALRLIHDLLSHRKQRSRVTNSYSEWLAVMLGVTQRSVLEPLLLNIFLADLFLIHNYIDIANFEDDNTPYLSAENVENVMESLERASVLCSDGLKIIF